MRKRHILILLLLVLIFALAGTIRAGQRPLLICVLGQEGTLLDSDGQPLQELEFDGTGQAIAGPVPPGRYAIKTDSGNIEFTLCTNASLCRVSGPGWTDGERLHLGGGTGTLTILFDGKWACSLSGETAADATPVMTDGCCIFNKLPFGAYSLRCRGKTIPILLTPEDPAQTIDLRK